MVSWLMTIKAVLISTGVASVGLLLKVSVPVAVDFSVSQAPILWSSLLSWLKPPYLYILTNGIIITIVASSKYYRSASHHEEEDDGIVYGGGGDYELQTELIVHDQASPRMLEEKDRQFDFVVSNLPSRQLEPETVTAVLFKDAEEEKIKDVVETVEDEDETESELKSVIMMDSSDLIGSGGDEDVMLPPAISNQTNLQPRMTESENIPPTEKPLVSSRFGHRKSVKASPEGGRPLLRVAKPKRNETLENTWKMITEGKSTTLTRPLYRRSDTFSRIDSGGEARPVYKKSETFRDRTNYYRCQEMAATKKSKGKVRKEPSLSQDELNTRVEAFIKKFNEEMKLQRMESLRQYQEITGRGV